MYIDTPTGRKWLNPYHEVLVSSYPDIDLVKIDPSDPIDVAAAVLSQETGDKLFEFLWHELYDCAEEGGGDPVRRMTIVFRDVQAVLHAILCYEENRDLDS